MTDRSQLIGQNLQAIRQNIDETAQAYGRDPDSIRLVAISKTFPPQDVEAALAAGQRLFGENRAQELVAKAAAIRAQGLDCQWHMVGTLQTNKVRQLVGLVSLIHSVDSLRLVQAIQKEAEKRSIQQAILLQVNVSGEASKHGFEPADLEPLLRSKGEYPNLVFSGLMTMAPFFDDPEEAGPVFARLRDLRDSLADRLGLADFKDLSMGMTGDYRQAIREGATLIRLGGAVFGRRAP